MTATLKTLVNFNWTYGAYPEGSLIIDSAGNLFGTTLFGGAGMQSGGGPWARCTKSPTPPQVTLPRRP
jgi:hypothetical protein